MSTADRLLSTLQIFSPERPEWSVEEAASTLGMSVSTMYRYFNSLTDAGFLDSVTRGRYVLGPAFIAYDRQIRMMDPILKLARPVMQRLVRQSNDKGVALLCRRYRGQIMCVHQEYAGEPDNEISFERGRPLDMMRAAPSKAILAHLPPRTLAELYRAQADLVREVGLGDSLEEFRAKLRQIRAAGFSISRGELDPERMGVAAPIFTQDGVVGSISIVLHKEDATNPFVANVTTLVQAAGREIDAGLSDMAAELDADARAIEAA